MRLLLVEDNERFGPLLAEGLRRAGFAVDLLTSVADAEVAIATVGFGAVLMDLGLPDGDGLELLRRVRASGNDVPVLILTARDRIGDRVKGLDAGADDYLVKPFALEELVARANALLRRPRAMLAQRFNLANLAFDLSTREATVDGRLIALSRRERMVLDHLCRSNGRTVPKNMLEEGLYSYDREVGRNAVEVYVHRLRKKLADEGAKVQVETVRGLGYRLIGTEAAT